MRKIITVLLFCLFASTSFVYAGNVETIDKDGLKALLGSPELVLLDVRTGRDWGSSEFQIQGAVRVEGGDISTVAAQTGKDKTIVLYCA